MVARIDDELAEDLHFAVLSALAERMEESVMITGAEADSLNPKILYVNPAFTRLTGYHREEAVGATPRLLQGGKTERRVLDQLKTELPAKSRWKGRTYNYMKSGQAFMMEWEVVPLYDPHGVLRFYLTVQRRAEGEAGSSSRRVASLRRWHGPAA